MGERFLIDTNSVSDYFGAKFPSKGMEFMHSVVNQTPHLSVMTRIELLGYISPIGDKLRSFVGFADIYDLEEAVILQTIALRRARRIKIPDAVIAATALVYDLTLVTHNTSDFEGIPSLRLIDPYLMV